MQRRFLNNLKKKTKVEAFLVLTNHKAIAYFQAKFPSKAKALK